MSHTVWVICESYSMRHISWLWTRVSVMVQDSSPWVIVHDSWRGIVHDSWTMTHRVRTCSLWVMVYCTIVYCTQSVLRDRHSIVSFRSCVLYHTRRWTPSLASTGLRQSRLFTKQCLDSDYAFIAIDPDIIAFSRLRHVHHNSGAKDSSATSRAPFPPTGAVSSSADTPAGSHRSGFGSPERKLGTCRWCSHPKVGPQPCSAVLMWLSFFYERAAPSRLSFSWAVLRRLAPRISLACSPERPQGRGATCQYWMTGHGIVSSLQLGWGMGLPQSNKAGCTEGGKRAFLDSRCYCGQLQVTRNGRWILQHAQFVGQFVLRPVKADRDMNPGILFTVLHLLCGAIWQARSNSVRWSFQ